jgi:ABC-type transport system substrate-binding protein
MIRKRAVVVIAAGAAAGVVGVAGAAVAAGGSGAAAASVPAPPPATGSTAAQTAAFGLDAATDPLTQATSSSAQATDGTRAWQRLHRVLHGQLVVTDGGDATRTVDVQRGTVTAVSATSVTIHSADDYTGTYVINAQTKVRTGRGADSRVANIKTGDKAAVLAVEDGGAHIAKRLLTRPPG